MTSGASALVLLFAAVGSLRVLWLKASFNTGLHQLVGVAFVLVLVDLGFELVAENE